MTEAPGPAAAASRPRGSDGDAVEQAGALASTARSKVSKLGEALPLRFSSRWRPATARRRNRIALNPPASTGQADRQKGVNRNRAVKASTLSAYWRNSTP